jgi:hypothetical protein
MVRRQKKFSIGKGRTKIKAQSTLELTLALVVVVLFLAGVVKIFQWGVSSLVGRHNAYMSNLKVGNENFYTAARISLVDELKDNTPKITPKKNAADIEANLKELSQVKGLAAGRDGEFYLNLMREKNIKLSYSSIPEDTLAYYDPQENTIVIDKNLSESNKEASFLSTVIHEMTHADYFLNTDFWKDYTEAEYRSKNLPQPMPSVQIPGNSIDQEYNALKNSVEVYRYFQADQDKDERMEYFCDIMEQGEDFVRAELIKHYGKLAPF